MPARVEAEQMQVRSRPSHTVISPQDWPGTSNGQQLWWRERPRADDVLRLTFSLPGSTPPGRYRVWGRFLTAPDYGRFDLAINGAATAEALDLHAPRVRPAEPIELGVHELKRSGNELSIAVREPLGADGGDQNMFGLDYLVLTSVDAASAAGEALLSTGAFSRIYDPGIGETEEWYINDHCFISDEEGVWHLFGITRQEPAKPLQEIHFAHAVSSKLAVSPWQKQPFALTASPAAGEVHLWAPHVVKHDDTYYMFYCAGARDAQGQLDSRNYRIHLATSADLKKWTRHEENPLFTDGFDARDPMVLRVDGQWVMYYTANSTPAGGNHIVAARTSSNLIDWSERRIVYTHPREGTSGGPTESPFVVRRGDWYYLFVGPRGGYRGEYGYVGTDVFRSRDPFHFDRSDHVGFIDAHAPEVVRDAAGDWYISHCGWGQGGVYLAPLHWHDGLDDADASLRPATRPAAVRTP